MALLQSITENTVNGDVIALSMFHTADLCEQFNIDKDKVKDVLLRFFEVSKQIRQRNPMAF